MGVLQAAEQGGQCPPACATFTCLWQSHYALEARAWHACESESLVLMSDPVCTLSLSLLLMFAAQLSSMHPAKACNDVLLHSCA